MARPSKNHHWDFRKANILEENNLFGKSFNSLGWSSGQLGAYDIAEVDLLFGGWSIFRLSSDDNRVARENL